MVCGYSPAHSQSLNGVWGDEKPHPSHQACEERYIFSDSTFEYCVSDYDTLNPIRSFGGKYHISDGRINFVVEYYKTYSNFSIDWSGNNPSNGGWEITRKTADTTDLQTIVLSEPIVTEEGDFRAYEDFCIWVGGKVYYKIKQE